MSTFEISEKDKIGVKSSRFCGTIFKNTYPKDKLYIIVTDSANRFTPTIEDIKFAEELLRLQIEKVNHRKINQFGKSQYIDKNLNKYFRQYIGFVNEKGDKIIHINFYWNRFSLFDRLKGYDDNRLTYTSDFTVTLDGGSHYWNVNVNLTKRALEGLSINGVG